MQFNLKSIVLLLALSNGIATAVADAGASSNDGIYPLLKRLNPEERSQAFEALDSPEQKKVFVNRINDYRENYPGELSEEQNDILDEAIHLIETDQPTSPLLNAGAREAFGFEEFKRLLTSLDDDVDVTSIETTERANEARGRPTCSCSESDDWCSDGYRCIGFSGHCDGIPGCCNWRIGCGTALVKVCDGLCIYDD